jgi:hypothetical protein
MSKLELIRLWHDFCAILGQGRPPLGLLLLGFNGAAVILWMSQQTSKPSIARAENVVLTRLLLVAGNLLIIFLDDVKRLVPDLTRML